MAAYLDHLALVAWPFTVVPRPEYCDFLAGRAQLQQDVSTLVTGLSRRDTSSIQVIWSWLGAGKTHSLYFLMKQCGALDDQGHVQLHPIYTEVPKRPRGFFDLYQSALEHLDSHLLSECYLEAMTSPNWSRRFGALSEMNPDLSAAFRNLVQGKPPEQVTALRWLRGDSLGIGEFRRLGISQRISTADQAVRVLTALIEICDMAARSKGKQGFRLIWILDEFQRIARTSVAARQEINAGLQSLFNSCAVGLTIIVSFSGPPDQKRLPDWLSPEIRNRIGATKVLVLPPFQESEALKFVVEVLAHFRLPNWSGENQFFPFTRDACEHAIAYLAKKAALRPRLIMQAMNAILEAADPLMEQKKLKEIDRAFSERALKDYIIVGTEEDEDD